MPILVTGAAGFIGAALAYRLLEDGHTVIGLDNFNSYYDPALKEARAKRLQAFSNFILVRADCTDQTGVSRIFTAHRPKQVAHLAAQAGVRYSIENPHAYIDANISGFLNILESCRHFGVEHLLYASSSSVYGAHQKMPFSEKDPADHPLSLYGATKRANELMAHTYSAIFALPTTGVRFFTVYGPWGRPDMALFKFTKAILANEPIEVYNRGEHQRDFTYIDDVIEALVRLLDLPATSNPDWDAESPASDSSFAPFRIYNIGNQNPVPLMRYIEALEKTIGKKAKIDFLPLQQGDVPETWADCTSLAKSIGFTPKTSVAEGICHFIEWYRAFYHDGNVT